MKPHFLSLYLFLFSLILALSTPAEPFSVVNLTNYHQIKLPGSAVGPESIAFDCLGEGPYVGVSDGRILKWRGPYLGWTEFAFTSPTRFFTLSITTGDKTGRVLKYDPSTKNVTVLLNNLTFANGVALSKDKSFLLVAETVTYKIFKLWLRGPKAGDAELFSQLKRPADNIKRTDNGEFWVGVVRYSQGNQTSSDLWLTEDPVGVKFDEQANVVEVLDGEGDPRLESVTEVVEQNGKLWIAGGTACKENWYDIAYI